MAQPPLVPVIVGPTGVGKTAVAAAWAALEPITIVSADARQAYRGLDIGTAKPPGALLARVPHVGLDVVEPGERYSAGRFARDAAAWLAEIRSAGRQPVVVGGTGFYVRALAEGLFHEPPLDAGRRERLRVWTARLPVTRLAHWASRLDRRFAGGGRQRAARAIEVALLTGRGLSWWQEHARATGSMRPWYIHLTLPRDALERGAGRRGLPRGGVHARGTAAGAWAAGGDHRRHPALREAPGDLVSKSAAGRGTRDEGGGDLDARCGGGARSARCTNRRSLARPYPSPVPRPPSRLT